MVCKVCILQFASISPAKTISLRNPSRLSAYSKAPMPLKDVPTRIVRSGCENILFTQVAPWGSILSILFWIGFIIISLPLNLVYLIN